MVSIDQYRAKIGMFRAGKNKQNDCHHSFNQELLKNNSFNPEKLKTIHLGWKPLCAVLLVSLALLTTISIHPLENQTLHLNGSSECALQKYCITEESFHKMDNILSASTLAAILIIGNVEANPGPMDLKEFLAFLFVDAEDTSVKEVIKEVKASQDRQTNLKKIKSKNVDQLKATLAYLNDWDKEDENIKNEIDSYTKEGIAHLLLKKIYNMAPLKCATCQKTSHFKPGESCILACIRCNRSACVDCYESDKEKLKSISMFNKNIYFSCEGCTIIIAKENQFEESYRKKSCGRKKSDNTPQEQTEDITDNLVDAIGRLSVDDAEKEPETEDLDEEANSSSRMETEQSVEQECVQNTSSGNKQPTCSFYERNKCRFGISGKGCKYFHPKMCQRLLSHGSSKLKGCNKGGKCKYFHPPMCSKSMSKRICTNLECAYMHIKGTKRSQSPPVPDARQTLNKKRSKMDGKRNKSSPRMESSDVAAKPNTGDFLEKSLAPQKPPIGNGSGGESNQKLMELLQQLIIIQNQQLQFLHQPQHLQMSPQMTLQTQLPVIQQQRTLHI